MPRIQRRVTCVKRSTTELPEWLTEGGLLVDLFARRGLLDEVGARLRVQRKSGYTSVDVVLLLILFLCSRRRLSLKDFGEATMRHRVQLAALAGRMRLPTPSSASRFLRAVTETDLETFTTWLLTEACAPEALLRHPLAMTHDTQGKAWHVFDWDPTISALRHRALPEGGDLPAPCRVSTETATAGYVGRKRGEVRFSRVTLQHSGTGLWVYARLTDERGDTVAVLPPALAALAQTCRMAGVSIGESLVRSDGGAGSVGWMSECEKAGTHYLTRLARYDLLDQLDVRQHVNAATWHAVPSSGSGPPRMATELGLVTLPPGKESRGPNGETLAPLRTRVVVSRFRAATKAGAGTVIDDWQYELYGTNVPSENWPAPELVQLYYGRMAQENRFGQEDRELHLDRIFSYHLPGQALVVGVGLFLWNLRTVRGFAALQPPALPTTTVLRQAEISFAPPLPLTHAEAAVAEIAAVPSEEEVSAIPSAAYRAALDALDWDDLVAALPTGWQRAPSGLGLMCPTGSLFPVSRVRPGNNRRSTRLVLAAPSAACRACAARGDCGSGGTGYTKEICHRIPADQGETIRPLLAVEHKRRRHQHNIPLTSPPMPQPIARPPRTTYTTELSHGGTPGPHAVDGPFLIATSLRHAVPRACDYLRITVRVIAPPPRSAPHSAIALTSASRQRCRHTWTQRAAWNALPSNAAISIAFVHDGPLPATLHHIVERAA